MKSLAILLSLAACASAESLRSARVTKALNEVYINQQSDSSRRAATGDSVAAPSSVQTGRRSRAELTFKDRTITRLGQNSLFTFRNAGRDVELQRGSILLQVPKNAGGATIRTATITAAITGTTSMCEYCPGKWVKLLTLEGTQKLYINGSTKPVLVPAGKMIVMHPDGRVVPEPVTFDLAKLLATSTLAGEETFDPLPGHAKEAIALAVAEQREAKNRGDLLPSNLVISGPGTRGARRIRDAKASQPPVIPVHRDPGSGQISETRRDSLNRHLPGRSTFHRRSFGGHHQLGGGCGRLPAPALHLANQREIRGLWAFRSIGAGNQNDDRHGKAETGEDFDDSWGIEFHDG